jgi:hypothetical protein
LILEIYPRRLVIKPHQLQDALKLFHGSILSKPSIGLLENSIKIYSLFYLVLSVSKN